MLRYSTVLSVLTVAAVSAPYVCQAQNPAGKFKAITTEAGKGNYDAAIKICDEMLNGYFKNKQSRAYQQYGFYEPFYVWKKAELLLAQNKYDEAYEVYKSLTENQAFREDRMRTVARMKVGNKMNGGEGYDPYLTAARYFMGYCKYQKGVGNDKAKIAPDKAAFDEAIPLLEGYLKDYEEAMKKKSVKRKPKDNRPIAITELEKDLKLDGQICFMLMQSYLLKNGSDIEKAKSYLKKGKHCKGALTDEMAMAGLATVIKQADQGFDKLELVSSMIYGNPRNFSLGPVRMAKHGSSFFQPASVCEKKLREALRSSDVDIKYANESAKSAIALLGLVPNTDETVLALQQMSGQIKSYTVTDSDAATYRGTDVSKLINTYGKQLDENMPLEAFAVQLNTAVALQYGSQRLGKAGYAVLMNRYPKLSKKDPEDKNKLVSMASEIKYTYAQFCRATGDIETASNIESNIDASGLTTAAALKNCLQRMQQAAKDPKKWQETIKWADAALDPKYANDLPAEARVDILNCKVGAYINASEFVKALAEIDSILANKEIDKLKAAEKIDEEQYKYQLKAKQYQIAHLCSKLVTEQPEEAAKYCARLEAALNEYIKICGESQTAQDEYLPNIFFLAVKANTEMAQIDAAKARECRSKALQLCENFIKCGFRQANPDRVHDLSATIKSMAAGFILGNEIKDRYVQAVNWYEEAAKEAIAMPEGKGRETAATCYLTLVRGYKSCLKPGEDAKMQRGRRDSYINSFWTEVDKGAPNRFALQMVVEHLKAVELAEDKSNLEAYNAAIAKAEEIIKREAGQKNAVVEDVYNAINSLVAEKYESEFANDYNALAAYVDGFAKAPELGGISAQAALTMSKVNILQESAVADKDKLIEETLNDMDQQYRTKINQLSAEACYNIAQSLLNMAETNKDKVYKSEMAKRTYPYYNRALTTKDSDLLPLVCCGKAKALTIEGGADNAKEASTLYDKVLASDADYEVINMARFGKADSLLENKEYDALIKLATAYLADDSSSSEAIDMYNMLADAYKGKGDSEKAIDVYYNLYRDNLGTVSVSAPACKKMMEMLYDRNEGSYKDNGNGTFTHGDRWSAWYRGKGYCDMLKGVYNQMENSDKILYDAVKGLVATYEKDAKVQDENRKEASDRAKY